MANHKRKKHQNTTGHNYVKKILNAKNAFKPGTVTQATVVHDDWCSNLIWVAAIGLNDKGKSKKKDKQQMEVIA